MRVITGTARGVPLKAPRGMDTRPTMDQVKEGIFSAIQFEVEGRTALDLFAGSGQLGFEALSRGADKCVLERDKVLDLLDEISNQLPGELKQAKTIVESRNDVITNAKREAENILKQAEQRARQMISHEEVYLQAQKEADDLMKNAQAKIKELRQVTNDYVDDSMKRTEEAIAQALSEIRESRSKFRALVNPQQAKPSPIIEDV